MGGIETASNMSTQTPKTRRVIRCKEEIMKVSQLMTRDVEIASPHETLEHVAKIMASLDAGIVPVGENDKLIGMITDRDIAIRGIAEGKGPDTKVGEIMTRDVKYCFEDDNVDEVTRNMGDIQVRRLPVVNREKRLVGILSLGDIAFERSGKGTGQALGRISQPGGQHSQTG
jgi:CBS domain-containing protein